MGKRLITTLLVLLTIGVQAFAQSAVSGKVTDKAGEPLVGAHVQNPVFEKLKKLSYLS